MATLMSTYGLYQALKAEGFPVPDNCREARIIMGVDTAMTIQYDVFLYPEDTAKLGRSLVRLAAEELKT